MAGVTDSGFESLSRDELVVKLNTRFRGQFGTQFDVSPESPDGQLIGIMADFMATQWKMGEDVFNSYNPATTSGIPLDNAVRLNGIERIHNKPTEVTITVSSSEAFIYDGTVIPKDSTVATADGIEFTTVEDVVLPGSVNVLAKDTGAIHIAAYEINTVVTAIAGWDEVINPAAGVTGIDEETDLKLRARREKSVVRTGTDSIQAIESAINDLSVDTVLVIDNETNGVVDGIPAHAFLTVVDGGFLNEIAQKIYENKPIGTQAFGDNIIVVKDSRGNPHDIGVSRPTTVELKVEVTVEKSIGATANTNIAIKNAITEYVSTLHMGDNIVWSKLFTPINDVVNVIATNIRIAKLSDALSESTIVIDNIEKSSLLETNITIIEI